MKTSAFIRSYAGDIQWLKYCLKALEKRGKQFGEIIVAIPETDEHAFRNFDFGPAMHVIVPVLSPAPYVDQQICKVHADDYCKGDFVVHFDSDCIATRDVNVSDFFNAEGMPKLLFRRWEDSGSAADAWRLVTKSVLAQEPPFETMATHPTVLHRSTHELFRRHIGDIHGGDFIKYVSRLSAFSEFNALGNFALLYTPDAYRFVRAGDNDGYPRPFKQFWSRGRLNHDEMEALMP
jgi:hypothetical protein